MNDSLAFNSSKIEEVIETMQEACDKYKQDLASLELEIKNLDTIWGNNNQSIWNSFKEKYDEKKPKLENAESMMNELLRELILKQEQLKEATINAKNSFE